MHGKKIKFKIQTRAPPQFVRPINSIIETKFQLPIPTGRRCSQTVTLPLSDKETLIVEMIVRMYIQV